jgi:predicted  nucleic acid-binding Zn-ribbon protein
MSKNEITLDDLALMMKQGFDKVDERFEKIDERFEKIDECFEKNDGRFDRIENRLDRMEIRQLSMEEALKNCTTKDDMREFRNEIIGILDGIVKKHDDHGIEHVANIAAHDRFEGRITGLEKRAKLKPAGNF